MAFGKSAHVLTFHPEHGIISSSLPDWVQDAANEAEDTENYDASYAFGRAMAEAGATCVESYGIVNESVDVWRLPGKEGWVVMHFDGEDCDVFFYLPPDTISYMEFQSQWLAPMATKIMAQDFYLKWRSELDQEREHEPKLH